VTGERDKLDRACLSRFEAHGGPCGDVETKPVGRALFELERFVDLVEVIVRADLHGTVAGVGDFERHRGAAGIELDVAFGNLHFAGNHTIGLCTVTSLVPSGNVASTWMSGIISGTPSITSSRLSSVAPHPISSETLFPSRAPSITAAVM